MGGSKRIAIIGAGMAGLAAAYDLNRAGNQVTIYEGAPGVGGLAAGFKAPHWDWTLEKFYHHWFASDSHMLGLIKELGWSDQVLFPRPYTVIYFEGKFYPFDSITSNMPKFLLRHYSLIDVARFGLAGIYLRFSSNWKPLEQYTAAEWTRRYFGQRIYELFWRPMLVGKFGEEYRGEGQYGLAVGAAPLAHDTAGDVQGRIPGVHGSAGRSAAFAGGRNPAGDSGDCD